MERKMDRKKLIRWKVYIDRSRMYIGYIQFFLIIYVFIKSIGDNAFTEYVFTHSIVALPVLLFLFILLSLVIGYIDSRLGLREEEIRNFSKSNPVLMDIQKSLKELQCQVEDLKAYQLIGQATDERKP
jgi:amino acid permease